MNANTATLVKHLPNQGNARLYQLSRPVSITEDGFDKTRYVFVGQPQSLAERAICVPAGFSPLGTVVLPADEQGHTYIVPALAFFEGTRRTDADALAALGFTTVVAESWDTALAATPVERALADALSGYIAKEFAERLWVPREPSHSDRITKAKALLEQADAILRELYDLDLQDTDTYQSPDWQSDVWSVSQGLESLDGYLALVLKQLAVAPAAQPAPVSITQTANVDYDALTPAQEELIKKYAANFR